MNVAPVIPGIVQVSATDNQSPIILIMSPEKYGKSSLACTLFDYPSPGKQPLILAWDRTGPDSCVKLGYYPHTLRIPDLPGAHHWDKARFALDTLEKNAAQIKASYGCLITDCASTMVDRLHEDARRFSDNPNPKSHFGDALMQAKEYLNRIIDFGLPSVWLCWMREQEVVEDNINGRKIRKMIMGGPNIIGSFRALLGGRSHHMMILDKVKYGMGAPGADDQGYVRLLRTRTYNGVNAGGRYEHLLPDPCQPHLGFVMATITGRIQPQQPQQPQA